MDKRATNARYYAAHRDRLILRETELRPSTILELIDCLRDQERHPADRRIERLEELFLDLTGNEPPQDEAMSDQHETKPSGEQSRNDRA